MRLPVCVADLISVSSADAPTTPLSRRISSSNSIRNTTPTKRELPSYSIADSLIVIFGNNTSSVMACHAMITQLNRRDVGYTISSRVDEAFRGFLRSRSRYST